MNTKLTLNISEDIIINAKKYAKNKQISLSKLVETYLNLLTLKYNTNIKKIPPITSYLSKSIRDGNKNDYKNILIDSLVDKYL